MEIVFYFLVLIFSVVIHEVSHGYAAKMQGDDTAEHMGRLTLNPLRHIDPVGSVILPLFLYITSRLAGGPLFLFGWAKPVPYNPLNLKNMRWGQLLVAAAGPFSNLAIATVFGLCVRFGIAPIDAPLGILFYAIASINVMLGVFNLTPIPPLDGSKILFAFLPRQWDAVEQFLNRNSLILFFAFLFFGVQIIMPVVMWFIQLLTGGVGL
ncbi:MAG: site-2 protease family protein [Candidatus Brennerbacteria bacterium CG_4_8_14_3_um_filter_43_14]|uniref:Site-2 protease family protein n=1 Tax=Candidatus Brennerbacteria bacterium CG_4_8_14_3_um_filter_43_14 TaxID=1974521 RepID=A0A2H9N7T5_9BACT|nr:MAG: hypothetical protein AUJ43_01990 [Parcubacteria group bacterium CG1_02_44_31]PIX29411.1 MAG: site-2 protease family protein [Candidatus Brennerbacteria bacterium CG_4_8_14_3_um_filter_43_14]PJA19082.1 MAG: site-2 protease family protein [Candidatus Brennerbacteria bacterium CG_4_10_14_0_2_um_filter_43_14]